MSDPLVSTQLWRLTIGGLVTTLVAITAIALTIAAGATPAANQVLWAGFDDQWTISSGVMSGARLELRSISSSTSLALHPIEPAAYTFQARVTANDPAAAAGLIVRARDSRNFIAFLISDDGYVSLGEMRGGVWIDRVPWRAWPHVRRGDIPNLLRAECDPAGCVFFVNDERTLEQNNLPAGNAVGIIARSVGRDGPHLPVAVDQVSAWRTSY